MKQIPLPVPNFSKQIRGVLRRYLHARRNDLLGQHAPLWTIDVWIDALIGDVIGRKTGATTNKGVAPAPRIWAEEIARQRLTAARLRRRYEAEAPFVRAALSGALISVGIFGYRLWLSDGNGAGASLGAGLMLLGLALPAAYRCWQIRSRTFDTPHRFLRRPAAWWPFPLPTDYQP